MKLYEHLMALKALSYLDSSFQVDQYSLGAEIRCLYSRTQQGILRCHQRPLIPPCNSIQLRLCMGPCPQNHQGKRNLQNTALLMDLTTPQRKTSLEQQCMVLCPSHHPRSKSRLGSSPPNFDWSPQHSTCLLVPGKVACQ